mmetsp:Transcript_16638/g.55968  ORF Transcript_16638/g.55968 Transcript_16638/m.55968 type:complete len:272 (+) Transcript_16638:350-1165(+)
MGRRRRVRGETLRRTSRGTQDGRAPACLLPGKSRSARRGRAPFRREAHSTRTASAAQRATPPARASPRPPPSTAASALAAAARPCARASGSASSCSARRAASRRASRCELRSLSCGAWWTCGAICSPFSRSASCSRHAPPSRSPGWRWCARRAALTPTSSASRSRPKGPPPRRPSAAILRSPHSAPSPPSSRGSPTSRCCTDCRARTPRAPRAGVARSRRERRPASPPPPRRAVREPSRRPPRSTFTARTSTRRRPRPRRARRLADGSLPT